MVADLRVGVPQLGVGDEARALAFAELADGGGVHLLPNGHRRVT
jgi:hypothetical protein